MKRIIIFSFLIIFTICEVPAFALNIGTYRTESEYGLLDGLKFNWNRKDKAHPLVEKREESTKEERQKEREELNKDEYQYTKYLYDGKAVI